MKLHSIFSTSSSYRPMRRIASALSRIALASVLAAGAASCEDDFEPPHLDYMSVGEDVAVTIPISLPKMDVQSRASVNDTYLNAVHSLWIGIFDENGNMTSRVDGKDSNFGWYTKAELKDYVEPQLKDVTVYAKTGPSYIVAVANVENAMGVTPDNMTPRPLTALLTEVTTATNPWQAFNNIAIQSYVEGTSGSGGNDGTDGTDIRLPHNYMNGFVMSGCFVNTHGANPADWQRFNHKTYTIPSNNGSPSVSLTDGAIHLRRLQSHITFDITSAYSESSTEDIVDVEVTGLQVCNMPRYSWVYERNGEYNGKTNFSDLATNQGENGNASKYVEEVLNFSSAYIDVTNEGTVKHQKFDFWQTENKHTTTGLTDYNGREERKGKDDPAHGIFTALVGDQDWTSDNLASYIVLTCKVTYRRRHSVANNGVIGDLNDDGLLRTGIVRYTIHHGYVGSINNNATTADPNDFNCYRNCDYTYNVSITGLDQVVVEAHLGNPRNGVEGIVADVESQTVQLDAHYSQFNIVLTSTEINNDGFSFLISSPFGDETHTYMVGGENSDFSEFENETDNDLRRLFEWIEIKKTDNATTYAAYKPTNDSEGVMPFWQFVRDLKAGNLPPRLQPNTGADTYYTIFINEYTYEPRVGETNYGNEEATKNWHNYVNRPDREFYILTTRAVSSDTHSIYARSKYAIRQSSIQTYYASEGNVAETAIGIEHVNETQGLNLRNNYAVPDVEGNRLRSRDNGRWNVAQWLGGSRSTSGGVQSITFTTNITKSWATVLDKNNDNTDDSKKTDKLQKISPINSRYGLQNGPAIVSLSSGYNPANTSSGTGYTHLPATAQLTGDINQSAYDPRMNSSDRADYIEAINACMNRNRDENGNGYIDEEELKWYVPASGKYLRAILGRHSLKNPLMPYKDVSALPDVYNERNSRYLIYASNDMVLWAIEGLSAADWTNTTDYDYIRDDGVPRMQPAWQVRCIRNLGTDLRAIRNQERVTRAYEYDETNRTVKMTYYDNSSIRTSRIDVSGNSASGSMPIHDVTSNYNMVYKAFQISTAEHITGFITETSLKDSIQAANSFCAAYRETNANRGWRLPNQKEIAIMVNLHADQRYTIFSTSGNDFSGTLTNGTTESAAYAMTCTYAYFENGKDNGSLAGGTDYSNTLYNHNFISSLVTRGTQMSPGNFGDGRRFYIRCVRDVEP